MGRLIQYPEPYGLGMRVDVVAAIMAETPDRKLLRDVVEPYRRSPSMAGTAASKIVIYLLHRSWCRLPDRPAEARRALRDRSKVSA